MKEKCESYVCMRVCVLEDVIEYRRDSPQILLKQILVTYVSRL